MQAKLLNTWPIPSVFKITSPRLGFKLKPVPRTVDIVSNVAVTLKYAVRIV